MTRQGLPTAIESEGISLTTTLPAPMMQRSPMVTPGHTVTPPPNQQFSPMVIGEASFDGFATLNVVDGMIRSQKLAVRTNLCVATDGN